MFFHLIATAVEHFFAVIFPAITFVEADVVVPAAAVIADVFFKFAERAHFQIDNTL